MRVNPLLIFCAAVCGVLFFPHCRLFYFAPYLILTFYKQTRFAVLWRALGCGLVIDLFSSTPYFGLTALNYTLVCWILYSQRHNFFEDKPFTLPVMTFLFSVLSTLTATILFLFFAHPVPLSLKWLFTDLFWMPLLDAGYALGLSLPFQITYKLRRVMRARRRAR